MPGPCACLSRLYRAAYVNEAMMLRRLAEEGGLLGGSVPGHLRERRALSTLQMETIHEDGTDDLHRVAAVLHDEFGLRPEELPIDVRSQASRTLLADSHCFCVNGPSCMNVSPSADLRDTVLPESHTMVAISATTAPAARVCFVVSITASSAASAKDTVPREDSVPWSGASPCSVQCLAWPGPDPGLILTATRILILP